MWLMHSATACTGAMLNEPVGLRSAALSEQYSIRNAQFRRGHLSVSFTDGDADYYPSSESWSGLTGNTINTVPASAAGSARARRLQAAADHHGMYIGPWHATGERLQNHLDFMEKNGLDSIVIDIKDDFGYLTYDSKLELPNSLGAVKDRIHIENLIEETHSRGFYVIGRIVVFKDQQLFKYKNNALHTEG